MSKNFGKGGRFFFLGGEGGKFPNKARQTQPRGHIQVFVCF